MSEEEARLAKSDPVSAKKLVVVKPLRLSYPRFRIRAP
jgi:hypothetical protein